MDLFRHSDLKVDHKCGYEGGSNHTHEPATMPHSEFHTISRVSFTSIVSINLMTLINIDLSFVSLSFDSLNVQSKLTAFVDPTTRIDAPTFLSS